MGGKKKQSLKQMEKSQKKKVGKKEKQAAAPTEKKSIPGITMPNFDKAVGELKKMKVLTPCVIASRFELRISIAKKFLEELERKGVIKFVSKNRNFSLYKPVD